MKQFLRVVWWTLFVMYAIAWDTVTAGLARSKVPDWVFYGYELLPIWVVIVYGLGLWINHMIRRR